MNKILIIITFIALVGLTAYNPSTSLAQCSYPNNCDSSCVDTCAYEGDCGGCPDPQFCVGDHDWDANGCCCLRVGQHCELSDMCPGGPPPPTTPPPEPCDDPGQPTNLQYNCNYPGDSAIVSWDADPGADYYSLRFDNTTNGWNGSCGSPNPGDFCLDTTGTSITINVNATDRYNWWMHSRVDCNPAAWGPAVSGPPIQCNPNCRNLSGPSILDVDQTGTFSAEVQNLDNDNESELDGEIYRVFNDGPWNRIAFDEQLSGTNYVTIQGNWTPTLADVGIHTIYCRAWNDGRAECRNNDHYPEPGNPGVYECEGFPTKRLVEVRGPAPSDLPWWQVIGGDVISMRDISSNIPDPSTLDLILDSALGGFPGIAYYLDSITPEPGPPPSVSSTDWNVSTGMSFPYSQYTYGYFDNLIPTSIDPAPILAGTIVPKNYFTSCGAAADGYCWYKADGTISLASQNLDIRKVILFVDGDLNILDQIRFSKGKGFFMAIVSGRIITGGNVTGDPSLEGLYFSELGFDTGSGNNPLNVRGTVSTLDTITLQRDIEDGNLTNPAESFEFAPDVLLNFPRSLLIRNFRWIGEVNP